MLVRAAAALFLISATMIGCGWVWSSLHNTPPDPSNTEVQLHLVSCMFDNGDIETYSIPIPEVVRDKDVYAKGFCDSL